MTMAEAASRSQGLGEPAGQSGQQCGREALSTLPPEPAFFSDLPCGLGFQKNASNHFPLLMKEKAE